MFATEGVAKQEGEKVDALIAAKPSAHKTHLRREGVEQSTRAQVLGDEDRFSKLGALRVVAVRKVCTSRLGRAMVVIEASGGFYPCCTASFLFSVILASTSLRISWVVPVLHRARLVYLKTTPLEFTMTEFTGRKAK